MRACGAWGTVAFCLQKAINAIYKLNKSSYLRASMFKLIWHACTCTRLPFELVVRVHSHRHGRTSIDRATTCSLSGTSTSAHRGRIGGPPQLYVLLVCLSPCICCTLSCSVRRTQNLVCRCTGRWSKHTRPRVMAQEHWSQHARPYALEHVLPAQSGAVQVRELVPVLLFVSERCTQCLYGW